MFRTWPQSLPETVEVCAVQLPGRENRLGEKPFTDVLSVVQRLAEVLCPYFTLAFAFFGHSLGAFIAIELARQLRRENVNGLIHLFVSGQRAPQRPDAFAPIYQLPDNEFIKTIRDRYDAIPVTVLENAELMQVFLPQLRADYTMNDTYTYMNDESLDCPITCFGGRQDPETTEEDLTAWRDQTSGAFTLRTFPGDHFFLEGARALLLQALIEDLKPLWQKGHLT